MLCQVYINGSWFPSLQDMMAMLAIIVITIIVSVEINNCHLSHNIKLIVIASFGIIESISQFF